MTGSGASPRANARIRRTRRPHRYYALPLVISPPRLRGLLPASPCGYPLSNASLRVIAGTEIALWWWLGVLYLEMYAVLHSQSSDASPGNCASIFSHNLSPRLMASSIICSA